MRLATATSNTTLPVCDCAGVEWYYLAALALACLLYAAVLIRVVFDR